MRSSISWIDPEGLATTLARFGADSPTRPRAPEPPEEPIPVEEDEEEIDVTPELAAPPPQADSSNGARGRRPVPGFTPPRGALRSRLESFIEWLLEATGNDVAFIVDRDGLPLVDRQADPDLLAVAASVMQLVESINGKLLFPLGSTVTLELESDQLTLTCVDTPIGKYIVGQVGEEPFDASLREALADGLRRTFQPSEQADPSAEDDSPVES